MTLDELIRSWFVQNKAIAGKMATYAGSPAVFLQTAPPDKQPGWGHESQYPRIVNTIELRADNERKSQGLLRVDLYCDLAKDSPEDIEPLIRSAMKDIVMQPDDSSPYCFAWARTDGFELESNNSDKRIAGYEVVFDITDDLLKFYRPALRDGIFDMNRMEHVLEPGDFEIMIGPDSRQVKKLKMKY